MQHFKKVGYKSTFIVFMVSLLINPAMAQTVQTPKNIFKTLATQGIHSTITASILTGDWRVISLRKLDQNKDDDAIPTIPNLYYTKGDILSIGGQKYLVAYRLQESSTPHQRAILRYYVNQYSAQNRQTPQLLKDSTLILTLLNQDQKIYEIKNFDPAADIIASQATIDRIISRSNLEQLALATFFYWQDHHGKYPLMVTAKSIDEVKKISPEEVTSATPVQSLLMAYVKDKSIFLQPATHRLYLPNYRLSGISEEKIVDLAATILFYEDAPDSQGIRCVAYADGHIEELTEAEFQRQRKAQGISESGYPPAAKPTKKAKPKT